MPKMGKFRKEIRKLKASRRWNMVKMAMGLSRLQQRRGRHLKDRTPLDSNQSCVEAGRYRTTSGDPLPQRKKPRPRKPFAGMSKNKKRRILRGYSSH